MLLAASSASAFVMGTRPALAPSSARAGALDKLRAQEAPPPPPKGKLGATVDQDGKSNVWVSAPQLIGAHWRPMRAPRWRR